ncbi:MAG: amino acid adenylation domain-containing protein [Acidobacteriia bacterium]|nr:amino acid adenylation domain-containing protein [Terriglobia bacterium]
MSNDLQSSDLKSKGTGDPASRLSPAQREVLRRRLSGESLKSRPRAALGRRPTVEYPVTIEQEHLWLLQRVDPNVYYFNHTQAYLLKGELDVPAMERALNEIVRRHENFRTCFPEVEGRPTVRIAAEMQLPLQVVEVAEFPAEDRHERLQRLITENICRPFDILNGPLVRATLFRAAPREHAFVITIHHILTDFVSYGLLNAEIFALYYAFSRGLPSPLPELPVQYGDFAWWLNEWMKSGEAEKQTEYWTRKLADLPRLDLPTDMPRPRFRTFSGERIRWEVPAPLWEAFRQMAVSEKVSRFTAFIVIYALLLRAHSGKDDVAIATPVSIRRHPETQFLIGYFLNTIVYRLDLSGEPTLRELLGRARAINLQALANSDLPFEHVLNKLHLERDPGRAPLVGSSYAYATHVKVPASSSEGLTVEAFDPFYRSAWLDMNLAVNDNDDDAVVVLDYVTDLFHRETVERMMVHFQRLLARAVETPQDRVTDFTLLDDVERQQILTEWNGRIADYPMEMAIHTCFAAQAVRSASETALRSAAGNLTYAELNVRANRLAHRLLRMSVGPETRVAVLMERSVNVVVASLAVLKAGGAYLPLHSGDPDDRLAMILEEAGAPVLLLDRTMNHRGFRHGKSLVVDDDPALADEDDSDPAVMVQPEQLACVIYTSGSTGVPKGVAVTHRSVLSLAFDGAWRQGSLGRVLIHSPHAFDASTCEIWAPLLRGKQAVIAPAGELDIGAYKRVFAEERVTFAFITSGLFNALAQEGPGCFSGLSEVWVGGDVVSAEAVRRVREHCPEILITNAYGPTEATTFATLYAIGEADKLVGRVPIGRAMDNHQAYVVDAQLNPVAVGAPGELCLAGPGVARGYLNCPGLTAQKFVPNPFGPPGTLMYRTGDMARWRSDGQLDFLGRMDNDKDQQIKLRGFRVEPGEIESALLRCAGVGQAVAMVREDHPGEKRMVAYVVPDPGVSVDLAGLRKALAGMLPDYMMPSFISVMDALPLTSSGKVDRKALPSPDLTRAASRAPRTQPEKTLCSLLAELLKVPNVGLDDNFFDLGGDSILANQLVSRAQRAGLGVTLRDILEQKSVEALANLSHE